jgi:hypothetical protein
MAITLAEAAKLSDDELKRGVIETFVMEPDSVILDRLPFLEIAGNSYKYNEEATLPGSSSAPSTRPTRRAPARSTRRPSPW